MKNAAIATLLSVIAASTALAEGPTPGERGTEGLSRIDVRIDNSGETPLSCEVKLAHWYAEHLATLPPGARVHVTLWSDRASGTVYRLNGKGDRMPVERMWCGREGQSWETRHEIGFARRAGEAAAALTLACAATTSGTDCTTR